MEDRFTIRKIAIDFIGNDWESVPFSESENFAQMSAAVHRTGGIAWVVDHNSSNGPAGWGILERL